MDTRRLRIVSLTGWGLCLLVGAVVVLRAYGADLGTIGGYTLAFLIWLVLLFVGWRWFRRLDGSDDGA
jgi:hypothetical protein